ncbi:hypothetical protein [Glutamicibacter sp. NPDC087673]|uniref:hypothetical protein n=1 Tax=Glutamicibacter sp. NPDC087673 TaxID=3363997 RepID=UPI00381CEFF7
MVVTNYAPQFGELDPIRLDLPVLTVARLEDDHARHDACYPVDGDGLARRQAELQHRRAEDASMTTLPLVPWAQHQLEIDKCGATGLWLHSCRITESDGGTKVALPLGPVIHSYRRWADQ